MFNVMIRKGPRGETARLRRNTPIVEAPFWHTCFSSSLSVVCLCLCDLVYLCLSRTYTKPDAPPVFEATCRINTRKWEHSAFGRCTELWYHGGFKRLADKPDSLQHVPQFSIRALLLVKSGLWFVAFLGKMTNFLLIQDKYMRPYLQVLLKNCCRTNIKEYLKMWSSGIPTYVRKI